MQYRRGRGRPRTHTVHTPKHLTVCRLSAGHGTAPLDKTRDKDNVEEEQKDSRHRHSDNDDEGNLPLHLQDRIDGPGLDAGRR
jgi:hypothetical protein